MMKASTIQTLMTLTNAPEIVSELTAELERVQKNAERRAEHSQAKNSLYDAAFEVVAQTLTSAGAPLTASEVWEDAKDSMPDGFTVGKLVYGLSRLWADRVVKVEGKVNAYRMA